MNTTLYNDLKKLVCFARMPSAILSVEKNKDGSCGAIRFISVNEPFKRSFYSIFAELNLDDIKYEDFDDYIEGQEYNLHLPKEPKFENIVFKAAWEGQYIHTYVDTTNLYGFWTEDFLSPICCEHEDNISYCQFMYRLNKDMDTKIFSAVPPEISSFIIKTCLELHNENGFMSNINTVAKDIREYTDSFTASLITVKPEERSFYILSESVLNDAFSVKEIFKEFSYDIFDDWEKLLADTNLIIIQNEADMLLYEAQAPEWVATLRRDNVKSLCLVPLTYKEKRLGYLYIANFDIGETDRIKKCIELIAFFLSAEIANHL